MPGTASTSKDVLPVNAQTPALAAALLIAGLTAVATPGAAQLLTKYDVVGTDPTGDAAYPLAPGANEPTGNEAFWRPRFDIQALYMEHQGNNFQIRLQIGYYGTNGTHSAMYRVGFDVGGSHYFTCMNYNRAGGQSSSNAVACSKFTSGTQVGPTTPTGTTAASPGFLRWEIAKSAIGNAKIGTQLTNIVVETYARVPSSCCPGSTVPADYAWALADRAPDTGSWTFTLGDYFFKPAVTLTHNLTVTPTNVSVPPGTTAAYEVELVATGTGATNITFNLTGVPEGWVAAVDPAAVFVNQTLNRTRTVVAVDVPADAEAQTLHLVLNATAAHGPFAVANLTLVVDPAASPPPGPGGSQPASPDPGEPSPSADDSGAPQEAGGTPGPLGVAALAALAAAAWARPGRRRQA